MKKNTHIIGAGLLTAIASSLCCITPILAVVSGTAGIASTFAWLEPFRPYLIGFTILVLGFAWFQKLKPQKKIVCDCKTDEKDSFFQSRLFLGIVTLFAIIMTAFPYYSSVFYSGSKKNVKIANTAAMQTVKLGIEGMTCHSCENHIEHTVNELDGIINIKSSYKNGTAEIEFDPSKTSLEEIKNTVNKTGYSVSNTKE